MNKPKTPVTVLLAVKNEQANMERCLTALEPFERVIVLDSQSTDRTAEIAERFGAEVVPFVHKGGYPKKRQWALDNLEFKTPWVLLLDADEVVTPELHAEIKRAIGNPDGNVAFFIRKGFHFLGRRFRYGGFSHTAVLLVQPGKARFEELISFADDSLDMEVHERVMVDGPVGNIESPLIHEDFKGLEKYIDKHNRYSTWEARLRYSSFTTGRYGKSTIEAKLFGNAQERRRWIKAMIIRLPFEPWLWFFFHYVYKLGFLEGRAGLIASQIRKNYIAEVRAKIYELQLKDRN